MSLGKKIRALRKKAGKTQAQLADLLGVSFQAVSSWENEEYLPDVERLSDIADCLGVSVNRLLEKAELPELAPRESLAVESHMRTMLKASLRQRGFGNAFRALSVIDIQCAGSAAQSRRPLHTACHALALEIGSDKVLTLLLLGGLARETGLSAFDLQAPCEYADDLRLIIEGGVNPASPAELKLAECIDSIFILSTAAITLSCGEIAREVEKTESKILPMLQTLKNEKPEWNNAVYLLRYQALALSEAYKRLL